MNAAVESGGWTPDSWQRLPALQQPVYKDKERLARVLGELVAPAADRRLLGSRPAEIRTRRGPARRALPAAGGRLRRGIRRLRFRHHRAQAQDPAADERRAAARAQEAGDSRGPHRGPVRQAAVDRHGDARRRHAADLSRRPRQPGRRSRPRTASRTPSCCCAVTSAPRSRSTSCARWSTAVSRTCITRSTGTSASCSTRSCAMPTGRSSIRSRTRSISMPRSRARPCTRRRRRVSTRATRDCTCSTSRHRPATSSAGSAGTTCRRTCPGSGFGPRRRAARTSSTSAASPTRSP